MKTTASVLRNVLATAALALLPLSAHAQLSWGSSGTGGSGTWNDVNTNWWNGASDVIWNSGSANFAATAGTVTVSGTQSATGLRFGTNSYTLSGGTINLTGTPTITGAVGITIDSTLVSSTGVSIFNGKRLGGTNVNLNGIITADGNGTSAAVLRVGSSNALGSSAAFADRVSLVQGAQGAVLQVDNGVVLNKYIENTGAVTIETTTGSSSLTGNVVPGGTLIYTMAANTQLTLSGSAGFGQSGAQIQVTGAGRLVVDAAAGATVYGGLFIRNSAPLQVNSGATLGSANVFFDGVAGTPILSLNGATVSNNVFFGSAASPVVENMAAGSSTFSGQLLNNGGDFTALLRSTTPGTLNVSGNIDDGSRTASVRIGDGSFLNSGVVNLSRASGNTYDGGTDINSGTLLVNNTSNSATGTGAVNVNSGGKLGGDGLITGAVTITSGGTIAPGNSPGILSTGNLALNSGGMLSVEINSITVGTGYDQVNVTGSVTLGGDLAISLGFTPVQFDNFFLIRNDGADAISGLIGGYTQGSSFNLGGFNWLVSYTGDSVGNTFTGGNDLVIQAVPEPNTVALLVLTGMGGMIFLRRRKPAPATR